jgi:hypothetical protein
VIYFASFENIVAFNLTCILLLFLISELALYALDVYYMQTYSGGSGGSGYNRIDRDDKHQYQAKIKTKFWCMCCLKG